jgi:hypothetical protein
MPIDPHDGGPDDWFVPAADGYPDDWFVPASDGYPDDWFVPASSAPATAQPTLGPQPRTANPAPATRPAPPPGSLADYWSRVPASRVGAMAWHPPIFLNSPGQSPLGAPAPPDQTPAETTGPTYELDTRLVQPVSCQGPTCSQGGSFGMTGMYFISGRTLCRDCAVKFLGIQGLPAAEQTAILRNFLK